MKTSLPTPIQRQRYLTDQHRRRQALALIEELAKMRTHWRVEDVPPSSIDALVEAWPELTIAQEDIDALAQWDDLPAHLGALVYNLSTSLDAAWRASL